MNTLFSNITVVTMDPSMTVLTDAFVGITDGKISYLSKKAPEQQPQQIIDGTGMVLMPGLVNCRINPELSLLRGLADDCSEAVRLGEKIYPMEEKLDDRAAEAAALLTFAQCVRFGVTSVSALSRHPGAVAKAAASCGIKANVAMEAVLVEDEDFDFETNPDCQALVDAFAQWHGHDDGRIRIDAGIQGEYTSAHPLWEALTEFAVNNGLGVQLPLSQTREEHEDCLDRTGLTPAQLLDCHGLFKVPAQAAFCTHLEPEDMALLGRRKATAVHCPVSDAKLAHGTADIMAMVKQGMNVALGTESAPNVGDVDLLRQVRAAALTAKAAKHDPEAIPAAAALLMATVCGAKAQGRDRECGVIAVGMDADLCVLDFTQPHLIPCHNVINNVVYGASGHDVCMTMVRGQIVYAAGKYPTINLQQLMKELAEHGMAKLLEQ